MIARLRRRLALLILRKPLLPFLLAANFALLVFLMDEAEEIAACLCFAAPGLLGVRVSRSGPGRVGRLLTSVWAAGAIAFPISDGFDLDLVLLTVAYTLFVAATAFLLRHAVRWSKLVIGGGQKPPVQFSVRGLLIATTAVAVGIPLLRFLDVDGFVFWLFLSWSPLPIAACWINRRVQPWPRTLLLIMAASLATSFVTWLFFFRDAGHFAGGLLQGVSTAAWLLGLRVTLRTLAPPRKRVAR